MWSLLRESNAQFTNAWNETDYDDSCEARALEHNYFEFGETLHAITEGAIVILQPFSLC